MNLGTLSGIEEKEKKQIRELERKIKRMKVLEHAELLSLGYYPFVVFPLGESLFNKDLPEWYDNTIRQYGAANVVQVRTSTNYLIVYIKGLNGQH